MEAFSKFGVICFGEQMLKCIFEMTFPRSAVAFYALWSNALRDPNFTAKVIHVGEVLVGYISCFKTDGLDSVG